MSFFNLLKKKKAACPVFLVGEKGEQIDAAFRAAVELLEKANREEDNFFKFEPILLRVDTDWSKTLRELNRRCKRFAKNEWLVPSGQMFFLGAAIDAGDCCAQIQALKRNAGYIKAETMAILTEKPFNLSFFKELVSLEKSYCVTDEKSAEELLSEKITAWIKQHSMAELKKNAVAGYAPKPIVPPMAAAMPAPAPMRDFDSDEYCFTCALESEMSEFDIPAKAAPRPSAAFMPPPPQGGTITQCPACGSFGMSGQIFCARCGHRLGEGAPSKAPISKVQFSAVVPKRVLRGEYAMIEIAAYEEAFRHIVDRMLANADGEAKEVSGSVAQIAERTKMKICLSSPDLPLEDCEETQQWLGNYLTFDFAVEIPENYAKKQILFIASVYFDDVIASKLKFLIRCDAEAEQIPQIERKDILKAFVSYAHQDFNDVVTIIQGMKKVRPEMDIFLDVENLRSGEDWAARLPAEIDRRDILFLCWSKAAKESEWVEKEWRYALAHKGADAIEPVPLVSPAECPPPEELNSKHFNDLAVLYRKF